MERCEVENVQKSALKEAQIGEISPKEPLFQPSPARLGKGVISPKEAQIWEISKPEKPEPVEAKPETYEREIPRTVPVKQLV
jgi:hypothetical protein